MSAPLLSADPQRCLAFLSEASKLLADSLDSQVTLDRFARFLIPTMADWCEIFLLEPDQSLRRAAIAHGDSDRLRFVEELLRRTATIETPEITLAMRDRQARLTAQVPDQLLQAYARSPEELSALRGLGMRSLLLAPLIARGRVLGGLLLATAESERVYGAADLTLAEDLAARAALAIDNARLYESARSIRAQAQSILDHAPVVIYVVDLQGRLQLVNRAYERLFQRSAEELIGKTIFDLVPREKAQELWDNSQRVIATGRALTFEETIVSAEGPRTHLSIRFPIHDEGGTLRGYGGLSTDITERKAAEEELRASQERFAKIFRSSTLAVSITRLSDRRLVDANEAMERLTGYPLAEMLGKTGEELKLFEPTALDHASAELRKTGFARGVEFTLRHRSGELHRALLSVERIEHNGEACVLGLTHDITELKQLQGQLRQAQKMEALGRLAGGVAHDFNNILTTISGYANLLRGTLPSEAREGIYGQRIEQAAGRAAKLVEQLLVFGRRQSSSPTVLDLNDVARGLAVLLEPLIGAHIALEIVLAPEPAAVRIDPGQLEQLILNVVLNARDAMPTGGGLHIRTANLKEGASHWVRLTVQDTGVGMSEEVQAQIFEPFFTTKQVGKGTGLGLATVFAIVEQGGGRIQVRSAPGQGACFEIDLPRSAEAPTLTEPRRRIRTPTSGGATVLLVEDDLTVNEFACQVLRSAGYEVLSANDGPTAIAMSAAHQGEIQLLVSDVMMPGMSGHHVAERLVRERPGLRVLHISGYPGDVLERRAELPAGAQFLPKPFNRDLLLDKVAETLTRRG
jgi:PAS domain S-box-containing protein